MSRPIVAAVALVVLLSTLAGVAGGAPTADTSTKNESFTAEATAGQVSAADRALESGGTYWSGKQVTFDASGLVSGDASEADRTFELWRVTADGQLNQQVRTFVVAGNGTHRLETGDLVGRYAVRYGEQIVYVQDGVGYLDSPPDGSDVTVDSAAFAFARQTLSFTWSDPSVYPGQQVTLDLTSNRNAYTVAVSGGNLSFSELTTVFPESAFADGHDARADENVLLVRAGASTTLELDTAALEPGRGDLAFDVVDSGTKEKTDLVVEAPAEDGHFVSIDRRENVGDVVEANLTCSHCFLVVGGPGEGILDVVELTDGDGDGFVTVDVNTRYAGMNTGASGYPSNVEAYTSPEDDVSRYSSGATLETVEEELNYNVVKLSGLRNQLGLTPTGRVQPFGPGTVTLTVSSSDFLIDRSAYGDRPPLGSRLVIRDETDVRSVTLEPRELTGAQSMAAAGSSRLPADLDSLEANAGPRESVSLGDHLVFRFDVSGVFGYFQANDVTAESLQDERSEGLRLTIEEATDGGSGWVARPLGQTAVAVYQDPGTDSLYLAVQTGGTSSLNLQDGRYRARLRISGVDGKHAQYSTIDAYTGYPYLAPGARESASATATVEPPTAAIVGPEEGSAPHLDANHSLVVRGTTSLAPGGTLRLEATSTEYAWDTSTTATVNETGYWTGSLDLTEAPGEEFTVTLYHDGTQFDERTYTVRPPLENESSEGGSGGGGSGSGGSGGPGGSIAEGGLLSGLGGLAGLAVPIGGGIGVLVVVWVLWKLVIRRMLV